MRRRSEFGWGATFGTPVAYAAQLFFVVSLLSSDQDRKRGEPSTYLLHSGLFVLFDIPILVRVALLTIEIQLHQVSYFRNVLLLSKVVPRQVREEYNSQL